MIGRGRQRWPSPPPEIPKRPYLSSAIFYAVLALAIVGITWATGGGLVRAAIIAAAFYVIAVGWSWWRFHQQIEARAAEGQGRE